MQLEARCAQEPISSSKIIAWDMRGRMAIHRRRWVTRDPQLKCQSLRIFLKTGYPPRKRICENVGELRMAIRFTGGCVKISITVA
jgi:hypothetical protein